MVGRVLPTSQASVGGRWKKRQKRGQANIFFLVENLAWFLPELQYNRWKLELSPLAMKKRLNPSNHPPNQHQQNHCSPWQQSLLEHSPKGLLSLYTEGHQTPFLGGWGFNSTNKPLQNQTFVFELLTLILVLALRKRKYFRGAFWKTEVQLTGGSGGSKSQVISTKAKLEAVS